jgi:hypothetical protein
MTEAELAVLITETELKMTGLWPPPSVDDHKWFPDEGVGTVKPGEKAIRTFILTKGRAPLSEELRNLR